MKIVGKKEIKKSQRIGLVERIAIMDQIDKEGVIFMKVTPENKPEGIGRNTFQV